MIYMLHVDLINVTYLEACFYQVNLTLHFLNNVVVDVNQHENR